MDAVSGGYSVGSDSSFVGDPEAMISRLPILLLAAVFLFIGGFKMLSDEATGTAGAGFFLGLGAATFMIWVWDELFKRRGGKEGDE